jgi:hypothetical protein
MSLLVVLQFSACNPYTAKHVTSTRNSVKFTRRSSAELVTLLLQLSESTALYLTLTISYPLTRSPTYRRRLKVTEVWIINLMSVNGLADYIFSPLQAYKQQRNHL